MAKDIEKQDLKESVLNGGLIVFYIIHIKALAGIDSAAKIQ